MTSYYTENANKSWVKLSAERKLYRLLNQAEEKWTSEQKVVKQKKEFVAICCSNQDKKNTYDKKYDFTRQPTQKTSTKKEQNSTKLIALPLINWQQAYPSLCLKMQWTKTMKCSFPFRRWEHGDSAARKCSNENS